MHADRTNRALLTLGALLLIAAGGAGVIAGTNVFGHHFGNRTLFANPGSRYISTNNAWFWPAAAAAALIIALLALRWLAAVLRPQQHTGTIAITAAPGTGHTTLQAAALRDALTTEISGYRGVDATRIRILGTTDSPQLAITIRTTDDADLPALRHRLESQALAHARQALDNPDLPIHLDLTVTNHTSSRVN